MAEDRDRDLQPGGDDAGGTLADAIAQHLALKRDHGADPDAVELELEDALAPPRRDEQLPAATLEPPGSAPEPEPKSELAPEPAPEPEPESQPAPQPAPEPKPVPEAETAPAPEPEPGPKPGEITGTIEFEFGEEEPAAEPPPEPADAHDPLEDTPDFFEETPEHDKLWFDEAPPRKFDF